MADPIVGKVDFQNSIGDVILSVDPDSDLVIVTHQTTNGLKLMELTNKASLSLFHAERTGPQETARMDGDLGLLQLGGPGTNGRAVIQDTAKQAIVVLDAGSGQIAVGGNLKNAKLRVQDGFGTDIVVLDAASGQIWAGGGQKPDGSGGKQGNLVLFDDKDKNVVVVSAATAGIALGGGGKQGNLRLQDNSGTDIVVLDAASGQIWAGGGQRPGGGEGKQGTLVLYDDKDKNVVVLNAASAGIALGGGGKQGNLRLQDDSGDIVTLSAGGDNLAVDEGGKRVFAFNRGAFENKRAGLFLGIHATEGPPFKPGVMELRGDNGLVSIFLDGSAGDIVLANGDCAEEFAVSEARHIDPGTVMVLSEHDEVRESSKAYDRRVVGVVSGAGDLRPAIVLDRTASQANRVPVALLGKVYCKIDARDSSIDVGDLLTTSDTPGHAMKASDPARSFGAVIGKALRPLSGGTGLIPVLIALQ
jgi:hypothetical protein